MQEWLIRVFQQVEQTYEELPDWKKKLWSKQEFLKDQEISRIRQKRYNCDDWT